jgi:hypothetical protein
VNLSPACAERTDWLTEMLDNFTDGLLDILESRLLRLHEDFDPELLNNMRDRLASAPLRKQRWEIIYDQRYDPLMSAYCKNIDGAPEKADWQVMAKEVSAQLELVGRKINVKVERKINKLYIMHLSAGII